MQPTQRFKKTLLAGALILGTCNAFNASADLFPVTAGAIPDVTAAPVTGYTEVSFSTGVIGNKVDESCSMSGLAGISDALLLLDINGDGTQDDPDSFGDLSGNACVSGGTGVPMLIDIEGTAGSTVTVTVADVVGAGYTYTPTAQSCVIDFDGATSNTLDVCQPLTNNTVTGIGMAATHSAGVVDEDSEIPDAAFGYTGIIGKTRMILAGSITINSEIAAGSVIADSILVQVTYE